MARRKFYAEIPVLYFIATFFITTLHIIQYSSLYHNKILFFLKHIEASAVPLFLCIAGFLAYNRTIKEPAKWLWHKIKRIYIPYAVIMLPVMIYYSFAGEFSIYKWVMLLFALQGAQSYLIANCDFYIAPTGLGHFWYVTIILLCFLITALVSWIASRRQGGATSEQVQQQQNTVGKRSDGWLYLLLACTITAQFLLVYIHITIVYVMAFFIGYAMAKLDFRFNTKNMLIMTVLAIVSFALRLLAQRFVDGSILYDFSIAPTQTMLTGIWIFTVVFWLREKVPTLIDRIAGNRIIKFVSACVFEIYLIHSITLAGKINVFQFFRNEYAAIAVSLLITLVAAYIVNTAVKYILGAKRIRKTPTSS